MRVNVINFRDLLGKEDIKKPINPIEIFNNLDRRSGKEYLRDPQRIVLTEWFEQHRLKKDIIIKLHTGQGKTLIGLLILQSFLNEGKGPAIYICPDNYLVEQTIEQAKEFGVKTVPFNIRSKKATHTTLYQGACVKLIHSFACGLYC